MLFRNLLVFLPLAAAAPVILPSGVLMVPLTRVTPAPTLKRAKVLEPWLIWRNNIIPTPDPVMERRTKVLEPWLVWRDNNASTSQPATDKRETNEAVTGDAIIGVINNEDGIGAGRDEYVTTYRGDGSTSAGWPAMSSWVSFDDMFNNNKDTMFHSCTQGQANDSEQEVQDIYDSIQQTAAESGLDHRFILAIMMQESGGCVRVQTTNYGFNNPGLMQDFQGEHSCDNNGVQMNPCPGTEIHGMIADGASGTPTGSGLAGLVNQAEARYGATSAQALYYAARMYNSGSVAGDGDLTSPNSVATKCYVSDVANRLTGWVHGPRGCNLDG